MIRQNSGFSLGCPERRSLFTLGTETRFVTSANATHSLYCERSIRIPDRRLPAGAAGLASTNDIPAQSPRKWIHLF